MSIKKQNWNFEKKIYFIIIFTSLSCITTVTSIFFVNYQRARDKKTLLLFFTSPPHIDYTSYQHIIKTISCKNNQGHVTKKHYYYFLQLPPLCKLYMILTYNKNDIMWELSRARNKKTLLLFFAVTTLCWTQHDINV